MLYHRQLEFNTSEDKATKIFDTISSSQHLISKIKAENCILNEHLEI